MAENLPEPKSRKESYLAKAAGMDVTVPEAPESREEQYLAAIAEGGGGGSTINVVQTTGASTTDVMSQKAVTDALASAGGDTVYSDKSTSNTSNGGAVYIGNLDANQQEQPDPTTTDNHYRYFYALPYENPTSTIAPKNGNINILGECRGEGSTVLGFAAYDTQNFYYQIAIGQGAHTGQNAAIAMGLSASSSAQNSIAIGRSAVIDASQNQNSVALGAYSKATRKGEVNIGTNGNNLGYNNTDYRVLGGVHDPVDAHDAATKGYVDGLVGNVATALNAINNGTQS